MRESLQTAATLLAATSRHRGYLELVATLGLMHVRSLAALLYRSARDLPEVLHEAATARLSPYAVCR
ncbi:MAG: hypothetical protein IPG64_21265 [Haliea sp.]|nr:hypothetical protein [Haliea sp.]